MCQLSTLNAQKWAASFLAAEPRAASYNARRSSRSPLADNTHGKRHASALTTGSDCGVTDTLLFDLRKEAGCQRASHPKVKYAKFHCAWHSDGLCIVSKLQISNRTVFIMHTCKDGNLCACIFHQHGSGHATAPFLLPCLPVAVSMAGTAVAGEPFRNPFDYLHVVASPMRPALLSVRIVRRVVRARQRH